MNHLPAVLEIVIFSASPMLWKIALYVFAPADAVHDIPRKNLAGLHVRTAGLHQD